MRLLQPYCLDIDLLDEIPLLKRHRLHAQESLMTQKVPDYLNQILEPLYTRPPSHETTPLHIKPYLLEGCEDSFLLFLNGRLRLDLSSLRGLNKAVLLPFAQAGRSYAPLLDSFHKAILHPEKDPLTLLALSGYEEGAFLYIPPGIHLEKPLQLLSLTRGEEPLWIAPRFHLVLGRSSSLTLLETCMHEGSNRILHTSASSFDLSEGSSLTYSWFDLTEKETDAFHGTSVRASLKKEASFLSTSALRGPFHRDSKKIVLQQESASASMKGIWMGKEEDQLHTSIQVEHISPSCRSEQLFKGVLSDRARSSFEGAVTVHEKASLSEAKEMNMNLLLSKEAQASSFPNLAIHTDDMKANHGVTYGKLDQEALLYLRSRGLPAQEAEKLLIHSFLNEVLQEMPHTVFRDLASRWGSPLQGIL